MHASDPLFEFRTRSIKTPAYFPIPGVNFSASWWLKLTSSPFSRCWFTFGVHTGMGLVEQLTRLAWLIPWMMSASDGSPYRTRAQLRIQYDEKIKEIYVFTLLLKIHSFACEGFIRFFFCFIRYENLVFYRITFTIIAINFTKYTHCSTLERFR